MGVGNEGIQWKMRRVGKICFVCFFLLYFSSLVVLILTPGGGDSYVY